MRTPQVFTTDGTQGGVVTKPLTISALNAARASQEPQDFGEARIGFLPRYVSEAARATWPKQAGGM